MKVKKKIKICNPNEHKFIQHKKGKQDLICHECWNVFQLKKRKNNNGKI